MSIGAYTGGANGMTGIRKYLNDQGYKDDQITYGNGAVSLNGRSFYNATPQADGSTYAPQSALQSALKSYQGADNNTKLNTTVDNMYNSANTTTPFQFKQQQPEFKFDANSDPAYLSQLALAKNNIQTGQNNTMANLAAHGQGNSSYAATASQQVADREYNNISNQILPNLIQQAYQRYQDQNNNDYRTQAANYGVGQDQFRNQSALSSYLNGVGQQDFTNNLATNQDNRSQQAQDANFTGYYQDPNTSAIKKAMEANSASYAGASAEQQQMLHQKNLELAKSIGGVDTTGNGDYSFGPGQRTLAGQASDMNQTQSMANLTGYLPNGQKTNAKQQQDLQNQWLLSEQSGVISNKLADMYGIPRGTQTQAAKQFAMSNTLATEKYHSDVDQSLMDYQLKAGQTPKGADVSSISTNINRGISSMGDNFDISTPQGKQQIESMIITQTQDPKVAVPLYNLYSIPVPEALKKMYEQSLKANQ
jgi:hypothetical protein